MKPSESELLFFAAAALAILATMVVTYTSEVMPRTVAMAPGPNMIGIARGVKATSSWTEPLAPPVTIRPRARAKTAGSRCA
jgi:hypothetical protein